MFLLLPDSPVTAPMLTKRQRRIAVERLRGNQTGVENKHLKLYQVVETLKDAKTWFFFILGMIHNTPNGGISNFGTIIIKVSTNLGMNVMLCVLRADWLTGTTV
jgi:hypothetical protein